jgi:hypothetical protein
MRSVYASTIVRVQGPFRGVCTNVNSFTVTLGSNPTQGNILILTYGSEGNSQYDNVIASISETGVNWNSSPSVTYEDGNLDDSAIWLGSVGSNAGTTITITVRGCGPSGGYGAVAIADVCEYSGLSSTVDKTAFNAGGSSNGNTGATAATTLPNELWIGSIFGTGAYSMTQSSPSNGFTLLDGTSTTVKNGIYGSVAYLERIVASTGQANSGTVIEPAANWVGVIAAFEAVPTQVSITVTSSPATGSGFITVDGGGQTTPYVASWVAGSSHTIAAVSPVSCGSGCQYEWNNWSDGLGQSHSITVPSSATTYTATFKKEWSISFSYSVSGGGSPTAPSLSYTRNGVAQSPVALTGTSTSYWVDDGTTWSVTNPLSPSTSTERWSTNQAMSATASASTTISLTYFHQYKPQLSFGVVGGGAPAAPTLTANSYGSSATPQTLTTTPTASATWYDAGATWTATNPLGGSSERWYAATSSGTISASAIAVSYQHQYSLTMIISPSSGGTTTPTGSVSPGTSTWENATATPTIIATASSGYAFSSWSGSGSGSYSGSTNPSSVTMNAAITETANFVAQVTMTASYSVTGGGSGYTAPWFNYVSGGVAQHYQLTTTGVGRSVDSGSAWTVSQTSGGAASTTLGGSGPSEQWITQASVSGTASAGTLAPVFYHQYQLTMQCSPTSGCSSLTPAVGTSWQNAGSSVTLSETPAVGYAFSSWTCTGTGCYSGSSTTGPISAMNAAITETANFVATVSVTITSSPSGSGFVTVDGTPRATPYVVTWTVGDSHTIAAVSPVGCGTGCQYVWRSWSDGGSQTHTITTPSSATTYTATFQTQYQLTLQVNPSGAGVVAPSSGGWYNASVSVQVSAGALGGYSFGNWSGSGAGSYSGTLNPATVTMNAPITEIANFQSTPNTVSVIVTSTPTGSGFVTVDGQPVTTPQAFNWVPGSSHTIAASSTVSGSGVQYIFQGWSDSGVQSHSITVPTSPITYTATFQTQYELTIVASPSAGGTTVPVAGTSWQNAGSQVQISVSPAGGYVFQSWAGSGAGSYSGSASSATIIMNGPITETANFVPVSQVSTTVIITSSPIGSSFVTVDGQAIRTPQSFNWTIGSSHTLTASAVVSGNDSGTQYVFQSWSDGGVQSHTVTTPSTPVTYTASYIVQYQLTIQVNPLGAGTTMPAVGISWRNAGANISISVTPSGNSTFQKWIGSGSRSYSGQSTSATVTMNGEITETAIFQSALGTVSVTVTSTPTGSGFATVDGQPIVTPQTFSWAPGSTHLLAATPSVTSGAGTQYAFQSWNDGGAQSHTITTPSSATTYTVTFQTQYQLTMQVSPSGEGSTNPIGVSWQNVGSSVQISAIANGGFAFSSWTGAGSGSYSGTLNPATVTMNAPITETANFGVQVIVTSKPFTGSGYITIDGQTATTPAIFVWAVGSSHTLAAVLSVNASGVDYTFQSWSDGGAQSHMIAAPSSGTTYTAIFQNAQSGYSMFISTDPAGLSPTPSQLPSGSNQQPGTMIVVTAAQVPNWNFEGFSVTTTGGSAVAFTQNGYSISFVMPAQNVVATVSYRFSGEVPGQGGIALPTANTPVILLAAVVLLTGMLYRSRRSIAVKKGRTP